MTERVIFISWSGDTGKRLAQGLRDTILSYPELKPWVSNKDIALGAAWFNEIQEALKVAEIGIGCLASGSSRSPWLNFEAGALFGRLGNFKLVRFGEKLTGPLSQIQSIDGTDKNGLVLLLNDMIKGGIETAREWVNFKFGEWEKVLQELNTEPQNQLIAAIQDIESASENLNNNTYFHNNICFQHVISKSLQDAVKLFRRVESSYLIPAGQYPHYLISLQRTLNIRIKAVSLLDQEEKFWQQRLGREIRQSSHRDSIRVFVFITPEQFDEKFETLLRYAASYNIYAMSFEKLSKEFEPYNKDFGIIESVQGKLYVEYADTIPKAVRFDANPRNIAIHERWIEKIISKAEVIPADWTEGPDEISRRIFGRKSIPSEQESS